MHLNLLDYILIGILVLSALAGLRRGFIDAAGGIVSILVAILGAVIYYDNCAVYLEENYGATTYLAGVISDKLPMTAISMDNGFLDKYWNSGLINFEPAQYLAHLLMLAICFLLIVLGISLIIKLLFKALESFFSSGVLDWINRVLGMTLLVAKNCLLITVLLGILYPIIETAARMGMKGALNTIAYINGSFIADSLLKLFVIFKAVWG